ncbi:unnamed protein product [Closterium sp. NIES-65]|nr:unnamed protein product [Closterium sp. NIES-65]
MMVPYGLTGHWFAAAVTLKSASAGGNGPGLWRLQAAPAGGEGAKNIISAVLDAQAAHPNQGLDRLLLNLRAGMRAHGGSKGGATGSIRAFSAAFGADQNRGEVTLWPVEEGEKLLEEDRMLPSTEWMEQEVKEALKGLPSGKSPGQDGLPKEFFERNWELIGPAVMKEVKAFEETAVLSESFLTAVTILLHKKGDKENQANLTAGDCREPVWLPPVEEPGEAVSLVAKVIDAAAEEDEDWMLLLVDFQKAYDSVSREYLYLTLEQMGFPKNYMAWVKGLHNGAATRLLLNDWMGERVEMNKGVRQGRPLAPYLFICTVEPLCQEIARRKLGVRKRGIEGELAYIGYADDTTLVLKGKEQMEVVKALLDDFAVLSGLRINRDKTTLMPLGRNRRRVPPTNSPF